MWKRFHCCFSETNVNLHWGRYTFYRLSVSVSVSGSVNEPLHHTHSTMYDSWKKLDVTTELCYICHHREILASYQIFSSTDWLLIDLSMLQSWLKYKNLYHTVCLAWIRLQLTKLSGLKEVLILFVAIKEKLSEEKNKFVWEPKIFNRKPQRKETEGQKAW